MAGRAGTTLTIPVPADYVMRRDLCSYGYFLLAPSHWEPATETYTHVLDLGGGAATVDITQARRGRKAGTPLTVRADRALSRTEVAQARAQITRMLRLDEEAAVVRHFHAVDPRWKKSGRGRLMRSPTFFEDVIKTVTSCNVTWPSTVNMNRRLCEALGAKAPGGGHAFPSAAKIARTRATTLRTRCSVGYRDARIVELARLFTLPPSRGGISVAWFEDPGTPDDAIHEALLELPGIGPYAAANIMQLLGRYSRLPLDTESIRHGKTILGYTGTDRHIMKRMHEHFRPFGGHAFRSYWFELWCFYEQKRGPAWTWERETTGKSFTAALLREEVAADGAAGAGRRR
jgi:3-methyladenine DNA glycosylase/8-oxoguanine DNA glycosylase